MNYYAHYTWMIMQSTYMSRQWIGGGTMIADGHLYKQADTNFRLLSWVVRVGFEC